jgi:hypothetical protein
MAHAVVTIPAETDLLCEGCGYVLNGLPAPFGPETRCPECGKPTADSSPDLRRPAAWERTHSADGIDDPETAFAFWRFLTTTAKVLFRPTRFYRTLATRPTIKTFKASRWFARVYGLIVSAVFAVATFAHVGWLADGYFFAGGWRSPAGLVGFTLLSYAALAGLTLIAARLTVWEAAYRGYRLPLPVVLHGLHYHFAHYLPVALLVIGTVYGYQVGVRHGLFPFTSGPIYLYVLCGEVVLAAIYLFKTYWIAMRNMMYANA